MKGIDYTKWIPDGTEIHYIDENDKIKKIGIVSDSRKYGPERVGSSGGYLHITLIKLKDNIKKNIYFEILNGDNITMSYTNCIVLNPQKY